MAVTTTLENGIVLGLATALTVTLSSFFTSLLRHWFDSSIRLPACIVFIATIVSCIDIWLEAFFYDIHHTLGLFIPLIVTNCAIVARAESFASKNPPFPATIDGLGCGIGILLALSAVGALRELLYSGSLSLIAPPANEPIFLVAILPTGAFLSLATLIVIQRMLTTNKR